MTYYAVIDTNVIVSSMLKTDSIPGLIIDCIKNNIIVPLLSEEIINEYVDVLTRNKFDFDIKEIETLISKIKEKGIVLQREQTIETFIDVDDAVFL